MSRAKKPPGFKAFDALARGIAQVPASELEHQKRLHEAAKKKRKAKRRGQKGG